MNGLISRQKLTNYPLYGRINVPKDKILKNTKEKLIRYGTYDKTGEGVPGSKCRFYFRQ